MHKDAPMLVLIIIVYLILGFLYATRTPPWQSPDEPAHYNFVRQLTETGDLPELVVGCYDAAYLGQLTSQKFPPHLPIDSICYEHYQPPLYYTLASPVFRLTDGNLYALRFFSVILGALSLIYVFETVSLFMHNSAIVLGTTALVAFVPMHLSMLSSVNNDSLAELLFLMLMYYLFRWLLRDRPVGRPLPIFAGITLGLILLTKVTAYISIPLVALVLFLGDRSIGGLFKNGLRAYLPAAIIAAPLYIRNSMVYGGYDILGLQRHDAVVVGQLRTADHIANIGPLAYLDSLVRTMFHSFWGQFGWMAVPMDSRVYLVLIVLQVLAVCGLIVWLRRSPPKFVATRQALWVMAAIILLAIGIFIGLNLSFVQFQGRYLFTALMPLGLFFSLGLREAFRRRSAWTMAVVLLLLVAWMGVSSTLNGGLDKWAILIVGVALGAILVRRFLPIEDAGWFMTGIYTGLAGLAAVSVWWFIIPNL